MLPKQLILYLTSTSCDLDVHPETVLSLIPSEPNLFKTAPARCCCLALGF